MRSFRNSLRAGHDAERRWVEDMRESGRSAGHGSKLVIMNADKNTIHTEAPDAVGLVGIEIKERNLRFTSPEDYPFDTVFVDDLRGMRQEQYRKFAYVFVSRLTGNWVWLSPLDQDDTWTREATFDSTRQHKLPMLVAPKRHLRPASQLVSLLFPHKYLGLVDGNTDFLRAGGGQTQERDSYAEAEGQEAGVRAAEVPGSAH